MNKLAIETLTLTSALGAGIAAHDLRGRETGLSKNDFPGCDLPTWIGRVADVEQVVLPTALARYQCRNNQLAWLAMQQDGFMPAVQACQAEYGNERIAVVLGTSTSGILSTELAYQDAVAAGEPVVLPEWFHYETTHHTGSCARFVADAFGLTGPNMVLSTACSSSAKVFASAQRLLEAGLCDAAIVGGVDSLCYTTLYGFNALQLVSEDICRPGDAERNGLSIGEAAGFALVRLANSEDVVEQAVTGYGESADAHHMSTPHPEGLGAQLAMRQAMQMAELSPNDVAYINLHGTATPANDAAEDRAVVAVFGQDVPVSSTKGWTGHTLGAAGILEIGLTLQALRHGELPASKNLQTQDTGLSANILMQSLPVSGSTRRGLSNSFGFGGSNCSVVVECQV